MEKARSTLQHYEKLYTIMEYGSDLNGLLTCLDTRVSSMNPSIFLTIYRQSSHNSTEKIFEEVELALEAYFGMIEDCKDHPEWVRKIEEEHGLHVPQLRRVRPRRTRLSLTPVPAVRPREAKVLQVNNPL